MPRSRWFFLVPVILGTLACKHKPFVADKQIDSTGKTNAVTVCCASNKWCADDRYEKLAKKACDGYPTIPSGLDPKGCRLFKCGGDSIPSPQPSQ